MTLRAVIVDDEALARERVRSLLSQRTDLTVVAEAADGLEAVAAILEHRPDLVFLDVQMPEMDGFEVLAALEGEDLPAVVFVTAHDRYALKAFDVHAQDYLLKPFDRERFETAVERAMAGAEHRNQGETRTRILNILEEMRARTPDGALRRFVVRERGRVRFVPVDDVEWIGAEGNYVSLHTPDGSHLVRGTMKRVEEALDPDRFVRVHRSAIVNLDRIHEVQPWFNGDFVVITESGRQITTGETYRSRVQHLLKNPL